LDPKLEALFERQLKLRPEYVREVLKLDGDVAQRAGDQWRRFTARRPSFTSDAGHAGVVD
jgi:hypothetical protein